MCKTALWSSVKPKAVHHHRPNNNATLGVALLLWIANLLLRNNGNRGFSATTQRGNQWVVIFARDT